jgi:hypothetical protein
MDKNRSYEFGKLYRDSVNQPRPGQIFRTDNSRMPTPNELVLKSNRVDDQRYDIYGYYDSKMCRPSIIRSQKKGGRFI